MTIHDPQFQHDPTQTDPSGWALFTPKIVTVFREGYRLAHFRADLFAGMTVAIVALPLSMALAIASGVSPDRGLIAAIVGGFLVSLLGGSRFQIGGPAGAFIILVAATVHRHGIDGLMIAIILSGLFLMLIGFSRLGGYIKLIPYPVIVGFTAGIAIIIAASQIRDFFGLDFEPPGEIGLLAKLAAEIEMLPGANPGAVLIAGLTVVIILAQRRWLPAWPGILMAVVACTLVAAGLDLSVDTIGSRYGGIPNGLPAPQLPPIDLEKVIAVLPDAIAFALLGAIESLLSAVVADSATGRRHRSNCELVAQGVANIATALFGGICVTGTIARTATNVSAGAHGPVAGMVHSLLVLGFMMVAAPLAAYIPMACLAAVLIVVAWNMVKRRAFIAVLQTSRGEALVLLATFVLVVVQGLMEGIVVGFALGAFLFIDRMGKALEIAGHAPIMVQDVADATTAERDHAARVSAQTSGSARIEVHRLTGAFFFGAAATVERVLDRIPIHRKHVIIDCTAVPLLDSTAAHVLAGAAAKAKVVGVTLFVTGTSPGVREMLEIHGVGAPDVQFADTVEAAQAILLGNGLLGTG